ncbi:hypothetical protein EVAR_39339_1 [Eumeta japonica]|uniref:Uncharacterized protein n=1 Tax=Eumeta variegata TaxID=151549 RepID=A0A4C1WNE9_EUMVA|nr:hypothetical protein EVAR_39339_1 [Eumeta japonica]
MVNLDAAQIRVDATNEIRNSPRILTPAGSRGGSPSGGRAAVVARRRLAGAGARAGGSRRRRAGGDGCAPPCGSVLAVRVRRTCVRSRDVAPCAVLAPAPARSRRAARSPPLYAPVTVPVQCSSGRNGPPCPADFGSRSSTGSLRCEKGIGGCPSLRRPAPAPLAPADRRCGRPPRGGRGGAPLPLLQRTDLTLVYVAFASCL